MEKSPNRKNVQERSIRSNRGQHFDINCNFHELYSNPGTLKKSLFLSKNEPSLQKINVCIRYWNIWIYFQNFAIMFFKNINFIVHKFFHNKKIDHEYLHTMQNFRTCTGKTPWKETLNFVNSPEKQQTVWKQMLEDCTTFQHLFFLLTFCLNNLLTETEQNYENLSFHFGVIDKILRCS